MAHDRSAGQAVEGLPLGIVELSQQVLEIERLGGHPRDLPLPELARTVGIDLDPVPVRVAQVERLADEVVGDSGHRHLLADCVGEPGGEVAPFRDEEREVEETRVARRRLGARNLVEDEQLRISADGGAPVPLLAHPKPDRLSVVVERALEVGDRQLDGTHPGLGRQRRHRLRLALLETGENLSKKLVQLGELALVERSRELCFLLRLGAERIGPELVTLVGQLDVEGSPIVEIG